MNLRCPHCGEGVKKLAAVGPEAETVEDQIRSGKFLAPFLCDKCAEFSVLTCNGLYLFTEELMEAFKRNPLAEQMFAVQKELKAYIHARAN